ncbi:hypothetical protein [Roseateles microcysteis]|uniref:hypothetical protein n=1 Tax=Roseateles microcysteis TaxID=3119057 RepID=UPI002FE54304
MVENTAGIDPQVIEALMARVKAGPLGDAYNRAEFMEKRKALMKSLSDYLDKMRRGGR